MSDRWRAEGSRADCVAFDGVAYRIVCPDDLCRNADETLCGLRFGEDYDEDVVAEDDG